MGATFREVSMTQDEAEKLDKPVASPPGQGFTSNELSKIVPPLSVYETLKGQPYTVDFLGMGDLWTLQKNNPQVDKTYGNISKKVGVVEGWVRREASRRFMPDETTSSQRLLRMVEKFLQISEAEDSVARLNKIFNFVISSNKARAFKQLEKQLQRRAIDEVLDLDYVKPSRVSKFMPRKNDYG